MKPSRTTSRPLSCIAYCTEQAIKAWLDTYAERIEWAYYIKHKAEPVKPRVILARAKGPTQAKKDHWHIISQWRAAVSMDIIQGTFPPDSQGKCQVAGISKESDVSNWLLYAVHEPTYLEHKGEKGKPPYSWEDLRATDYNRLQDDINTALDLLDVMTAKERRRKEVQDMAEDESISDSLLLRRCRNHNEELTAIAYRQTVRYEGLHALKRGYHQPTLTQRRR